MLQITPRQTVAATNLMWKQKRVAIFLPTWEFFPAIAFCLLWGPSWFYLSFFSLFVQTLRGVCGCDLAPYVFVLVKIGKHIMKGFSMWPQLFVFQDLLNSSVVDGLSLQLTSIKTGRKLTQPLSSLTWLPRQSSLIPSAPTIFSISAIPLCLPPVPCPSSFMSSVSPAASVLYVPSVPLIEACVQFELSL